jgi:hypothetical protein
VSNQEQAGFVFLCQMPFPSQAAPVLLIGGLGHARMVAPHYGALGSVNS